MEKRCWTMCMHRFLAFLALKCNLLSIPAYLWSNFVFLSHFLAQTKHSHLFLFLGINWKKLFASLAKGINPNSDKSTLQSLEKGTAAKPWKGQGQGWGNPHHLPQTGIGHPHLKEVEVAATSQNPQGGKQKHHQKIAKISKKQKPGNNGLRKTGRARAGSSKGGKSNGMKKKSLVGRKRRWVGRKDVAMEGWVVWWLDRLVLGRQAPGCMVWGQAAPGKK